MNFRGLSRPGDDDARTAAGLEVGDEVRHQFIEFLGSSDSGIFDSKNSASSLDAKNSMN